MRNYGAPSKLGTLFALALSGTLATTACGDSTSDGDDTESGGSSGRGGKGGQAGKAGASSGTGGTAGRGGTGGTAGKSGAGGSAGEGGSDGKSGAGGSGGTSGDGGAAGEAGGAMGGGAGAAGDGGTAGEDGEAGSSGESGTGPAEGPTCKAILDENPSAPDGVHVLDPDGAGGEDPVPVLCDMTRGGWTLGLVKNSMDNGNYQTFASGRVNPDALAISPESASEADVTVPAIAGWLDLNEFPYAELVIAGYGDGVEAYRSLSIPKSELRIRFGQDGYYLYDQVDGYFWCGGSNEYTTNGVGQVDPPDGAPADCKGHTSLGNGWDFGTAIANAGLTVCGGGSVLMTASPGGGFVGYGTPGAAQAIWVR